MKILTLGSGGAFSDKFGNTQFFIESDDEQHNLLFDCGATWLENARECNLDKQKVQNVFISHLHDDHVAGLGTLALMHYFYPHFTKPTLYIHRSLVHRLWQRLAPGLETLADHQLPEGKLSCQLSDYFNLVTLKSNGVFNIGQDLQCRPVQTIHVVHGAEFMDSYGLHITELSTGYQALITSDTQFAPDQLKARSEIVDIIYHDCETTPGFKSGVHAHIEDLATLPLEVKEKMLLCHYGDNIDNWVDFIKQEGFRGVIKRTEIFTNK